jgi:hypothetical protein
MMNCSLYAWLILLWITYKLCRIVMC